MRCACGFRKRSDNHDNGPHHKGSQEVTGKRSARAARKNFNHGRKTNIGDPTHPTCRQQFPAEHSAFHSRRF